MFSINSCSISGQISSAKKRRKSATSINDENRPPFRTSLLNCIGLSPPSDENCKTACIQRLSPCSGYSSDNSRPKALSNGSSTAFRRVASSSSASSQDTLENSIKSAPAFPSTIRLPLTDFRPNSLDIPRRPRERIVPPDAGYTLPNKTCSLERCSLRSASPHDLSFHADHVYATIDDYNQKRVTSMAPTLPPRRKVQKRKTIATRMKDTDIVELDSAHVYTVKDVLQSYAEFTADVPMDEFRKGAKISKVRTVDGSANIFKPVLPAPTLL
ncbi:unnamed protein product [Dimorphilus gyrociliatus]|uniref:Uncharacterized protein n=1 Tax=Dimorphilus gyrociliatus TaxID=2664684 RepID=A0A7I8VP10_9ANNE|nr:unnamed protein product [Dimorphilus gyrociliatus]